MLQLLCREIKALWGSTYKRLYSNVRQKACMKLPEEGAHTSPQLMNRWISAAVCKYLLTGKHVLVIVYQNEAILLNNCSKSPDSGISFRYEPQQTCQGQHWLVLILFHRRLVILFQSCFIGLSFILIWSYYFIHSLHMCMHHYTIYALFKHIWTDRDQFQGSELLHLEKITKSFQSIYSISGGNEDWQAWRQLLPSSRCWKNKNSKVWAGKVEQHSQREADSVEPAALVGPSFVQIHQLNRKLTVYPAELNKRDSRSTKKLMN